MEFFDWNIIGTYAGALAVVAVFTQLTKELPLIKKIPTQVWSYIMAVICLVLSKVFTADTIILKDVVLCFFNAGLISLAANGSYEAIEKIWNPAGRKE